MEPDHVGITTNGRRFSFQGGPAYFLVAALFLIGGLWVFGEFILPKTSPQQKENATIQAAIARQEDILRIVRNIRQQAAKEAQLDRKMDEIIRNADRDMDRVLALLQKERETLERVLWILERHFPQVPPMPRHHSETP